jgi:hypothetical protein
MSDTQRQNDDDELDAELDGTFPASDPPAISTPGGNREPPRAPATPPQQ